MNAATAPAIPDDRTVLRCRDLHRYLGEGENRVHVLKGISLQLERGKIYAISGPSGCGKSTLLYLLGLLDRPDGGEVYLNHKPMSQSSDRERTAARNASLGFVFQFHFLLKEFSALENLMIPMRKKGIYSPAQMESRARQFLEAVGLSDKAHRLTTQLSGGEQQRVALARSLANSPAVILADEPTGNLDVENSNLVCDLLTQLARENDQAVLIVTHNPEIARKCDRVLRMQDGVFLD
ncbi:MAG: ATP-binding cassette domain-containing protein [Opitutae bacterium]|nr:ATP-binding cassette domain-containing protein [Opitutae bacterium]